MKSRRWWRSGDERSAVARDEVTASTPVIAPRVVDLVTAHGTSLTVDGRGLLTHSRDAASVVRLAWVEGAETAVLYRAGLAEPFGLAAGGARAVAHLVGVAHAGEGRVTISDLDARTYLSARPLPEGGAVGPFQPGRTVPDGWESFAIRERSGVDPDRDVLARVRATSIAGTFENGVTARALAALLDDPDPRWVRVMFSLVTGRAARGELDTLARELLADPRMVARLAQGWPMDPWLSRALPELQEWSGRREATRRRTIGEDLDVLGNAGKNNVAASPGQLLTFHARAQVKPTRGPCIVATARNEGIYLLEWIAYHRALGFEEIFLYSNANGDGSDELLAALADAGIIHWIDSAVGAGGNAQGKAYTHALSMVPEVLDHSWVTLIDIDEFLVLDPDLFDGVEDFLAWHERREVDAIGVNWLVVSPSGQRRWTDAPVSERFATRVGGVDSHIKSFVRPTRAIGSQPHFPYTTERESLAFREADGNRHTWFSSKLPASVATAQSDTPSESHAVVYHYALRSCEEFLWKFSRNRGDYPATAGDIALSLDQRWADAFLGQWDRTGGDARARIAANCPDLPERIEALRALRGVREAESRVTAAFTARSARVLDAYRGVLVERFGDTGSRILEILDGD